MRTLIKEKKGIAGLNTYLSLIVMLFTIGLLVMIFLIAGNKFMSATYDSFSVEKINETVTTLNATVGDYLSVYSLRDVSCTVSIVTNASDGETVPATNYTMTNCLIKGTSDSTYLGHNVNVTYVYGYKADNDATLSINETSKSIKTSTDFFSTFIVLGSLIVLVLLTVIIINSIRATGVTQEEGGA